MSTTETKRKLLAKARGEAIAEHYMRILDYKGNVISETATEGGEDWEIVVLNNKEELEEYENKNLH